MHPQSLHQITKDIFTKLSVKFDGILVDSSYGDTINNLHPHMFRHTWATLKLKQLCEKEYSINHNNRSAIESAKDQLRELGGWSYSSQMPSYYARSYLNALANESNLVRINSFDDKILESFEGVL